MHRDRISLNHTINRYVICARFAEGGNEDLLFDLYRYVSERTRHYTKLGNCLCHPHEEVISIGNASGVVWKEEVLLKEGIDSLFGR